LSQKLILSPRVVLRSEPQYYDTYAAFEHRKVVTEFISKNEYQALQYIYDKPAELEEISKKSGIELGKAKKFLRDMERKGFVERFDPKIEYFIPVRKIFDPKVFHNFKIPILSAPTSVDLFLTSRCNLRCVHCFSAVEGPRKQDFPIEKFKATLQQLEQLGVFEIRINGGEPFLHPEIEEVLLELEDKRFRRVIITNGTLLNEEYARLLRKSGTIPTISLDGAAPEEHDSFRGVPGSFEETLNAMKILKKMNVTYGVNTCIHRKNMKNFSEIIKLAESLGASRIAFLDLKEVGRMKKNSKWIPTQRDYQKTLRKINALKMLNRKIDVSSDVFLHCYPLRESVQEAKNDYVTCQAGKTRLSIDTDGTIYPCNLVISDPRWRMGNILEQDLSEIWFSEKWSFFRGDVKIKDLEKCGKCESLKKCIDFYCRMLPYEATGNPLGPYPNCQFYP
jgi:radical SAM protein with 4Fe4S-binding SPASM domain